MELSLLWYRTVYLRRLTTAYILTQEILSLQQTTIKKDSMIAQKKAHYIYNNKRLFNIIINSSSNNTMCLSELVICLSSNEAVRCMQRQEVQQAFIHSRKAHEYLTKIKQAHHQEQIKSICQQLIQKRESNILPKQNAVPTQVLPVAMKQSLFTAKSNHHMLRSVSYETFKTKKGEVPSQHVQGSSRSNEYHTQYYTNATATQLNVSTFYRHTPEIRKAQSTSVLHKQNAPTVYQAQLQAAASILNVAATHVEVPHNKCADKKYARYVVWLPPYPY